MVAMTAAGTGLAISTGTPASFDAAGFAALTYTEVGGVDKIGTIGGTFGKTDFQPLKGPKDKLKGSPDYGTLTPSMAYDEADAGQSVLRAAAEDQTQRLYPVRITYANGSIRYFRARVFAATEGVDGADSVLMTNASIEICTKPIRVKAGVTPAPTQLTVAFLGSSTPSYYFSQFTGTANARVSRSTDGQTFTAYGTTGQGGATFGNLMANTLNRDVRMLGVSKSGTTLSEWEANGSVVRANAVAAIKAANADAAVIIVGFNDARTDKSVTSQAAHAALYRSFLSKLRAEVGRNIRVFIGTTQKYNDGDPVVLQQMAWVRAAEMEVTSDPNNSLYAHAYDLAQVDGVHMADGQYVIHATRGSKALLAWVNGTAYDPADAGPTPPLTYTPPSAPNGTARINHTAPGNPAVSGYNNWTVPGDVSGTPSANAGLSLALVDTAGVATGWTATIVAPFVGSGAATGTTTGNDSGAAPDQVLRSNWFVGDAASPNARRDPATIQLSGYDPAALYTFRFIGARDTTTARETTYTVAGANTKSGTQVNNGNTMQTTTLTDMQPNADGTLLITVKAAGTGTFGYLNETRIAKQ